MIKQISTFGAAALLSVAANATLVSTEVGYTGPGLDLSAYANGNYNFTFGPKLIPGGITFTRSTDTASNSGNGAVLGQGFYGLGPNGSFDQKPVYAGLDGHAGHIRFMLDAPVSQFGMFVNYAPDANDSPLIQALDKNGVVFESWDLSVFAPVSTPFGLDEFRFRGIAEDSASIYGLQLSNSYLLATGSLHGDPVPTIPEPETYALMLAGLGVVAFMARRRRA